MSKNILVTIVNYNLNDEAINLKNIFAIFPKIELTFTNKSQ